MIITKKSFFNNRNPVSFSPSLFVSRNIGGSRREIEYTYGRVAGKYVVQGDKIDVNYMSGEYEVIPDGGE